MRNEQIDVLSQVSWDDESVLTLPLPDGIFGFHAQQAIEKLLKMLILGNGQMHEFTHSIVKLQKTLDGLGEAIPPLPYPIATLTDYAAQFRYTVPKHLTPNDRDRIRESIVLLRTHIQSRLIALDA